MRRRLKLPRPDVLVGLVALKLAVLYLVAYLLRRNMVDTVTLVMKWGHITWAHRSPNGLLNLRALQARQPKEVRRFMTATLVLPRRRSAIEH